jgi:membrane fusion protein, multidrug efflux system
MQVSSYVHHVILSVSLLTLAACGKPELDGGPPGDFKVQAVVAPVQPQTLTERIRLVGTLQARDAVDVVSEINAVVVALTIDEGRPVSAGDVLVRLDDRKLAARVQEAEARLALARTNFERGRELRENETISIQEFDRLQAEHQIAEAAATLARAELDDTVVKAPFDGIVSERHVSIGQYVTSGERLTALVRNDPLEVSFHVPERFLSQLALDQTVDLTTAAYPGESFTGDVFFIDPRVDEVSRTIRVKAAVSNKDGRLKPGMFAGLELVLRSDDEALLIPESAVQYRGDQALVFVMTEEGVADIRPVTLGARHADALHVTEGLVPGDRVVVEGYQQMFPGVGIIVSPDSARYGIQPDASLAGSVEL